MSTAARVLSSRSLLGDKVLLAAIGLSAVVSVVLGLQFVESGLALVVSLALLAAAGAGYFSRPGSQLSRYVLTFVLVSFVALHIQLSRGMLEFHFGVFVALAFLLVYQDWKLIVFGAALVAVHHIAFDQLQAAGMGFYCTTQPDFVRILLHAAFVVVQSAVEVTLTLGMLRTSPEGEELARLVACINRADGVTLDVQDMVLQTPGAQALQSALARMNVAVSAVRNGARGIDQACSEIARGNQDLSNRTEQTVDNLKRASSSMVALTQTVRQSAESTHQANQLAQTASTVAVQGGTVVAQVVQTMHDINESSHRISDIIGVIDGIAFQTNILALNAAVEAARAGDQGRGFAVVASEVRALAGRSADAAKEIKTLIDASVSRVAQGTALVGEAGSTMTQVVDCIKRVTDIMGDISSATAEQASDMEQVGSAVTQMDEATQQNASLVEQMADAASSLKSQSQELVQTFSMFHS